MNYILFLLKKVFKNKITYIPLFILSILTIGMLILNANEAKRNNIESYVENNLTQDTIGLEQAQNFLKQTNLSSEDKESGDLNLEKFTNNVASDKEALNNIKKKNWSKAYENLLKPLSYEINAIESGKSLFSEAETNYLKHDYMMFKELKKRNLSYENSNFPTKGINYTVFVMQLLFPVLLSLTIIFILSSLFSSSYYEKINSLLLLPNGKIETLFLNLTSGIIISTFIITFSIAFPFILGTAFFGLGSSNYPIVSYTLSNHSIYFQSISNVVLPSLILEIISFTFITSLVYLIANIIREKLATLFVSSIVVVGTLLSVNVIAPAQKIAHLLPTTYLNSVSVVTGEYAYKLNNTSISFNQGLYTLLTFLLITITLNILVTVLLQSSKMKSKEC